MLGLILSFVFSFLGAFAGAATRYRVDPVPERIKPAPLRRKEKRIIAENLTRRKQEWLFGSKEGEQ